MRYYSPWMSKLMRMAMVACALAGPGCGAPAQGRNAADLYVQYCAGCHGVNMDDSSASGGSLVDDKWTYGSTREAIAKSIREGHPQMGMSGFAETFSEAEIDALVTYIQTGGKSATGTQKPSPRALRAQKDLTTLDYRLRVEVIAEKLDVPWGIEFIDSNNAIVTERSGAVRLIMNGVMDPKPVMGTPEVVNAGQGGMLDVALPPDYATSKWVYLSYSHAGANRNAMTRIVRGRIKDHQWTDEQVIYEAPERSYRQSRHHYGIRMVFAPDGKLYFPIGDRGHQDDAQDLSRANGKMHRINPDGSVPRDNPFTGRGDALETIWSYGHRNPQGLTLDTRTGNLWSAEHGPRGGDELNLIRRGANFGWPVISYGINYNGTIITRDRVREGMEQPVWYWRPSTGLGSIEFYNGDMFPFWKGHLLVGALAGQDVRLLHIENDRVIHEEIILDNRGRVRYVKPAPDGSIYVLLNDPHEIIRLSLIEERIE